MTKINFDKNWNNKLDNDVFTTIRKWDPQKEEYYKKAIGASVDIELKGQKKGKAILFDVHVMLLRVIPLEILQLDTGLHKEVDIYRLFAQFGCYKYDKCMFLTFLKEEYEE